MKTGPACPPARRSRPHPPGESKPPLGQGPQRLLVDRRQAARLVAGGGLLFDLGAEETGVPSPPLDPLDQLLAHLATDGPARQQVLGAVDLGRLAEHGRAPCDTIRSAATPRAGLAVTPELPSDPRIRGRRSVFDAGCSVRVQGVRLGQQLMDGLHRRLRPSSRSPPLPGCSARAGGACPPQTVALLLRAGVSPAASTKCWRS